mmetsp:Transcript_47805/g.35055  ORF Transcript_47805/g.35055 Transcript_47805/m.35055 type:complete len:122 (+) Transcript_47805:304-669(+)
MPWSSKVKQEFVQVDSMYQTARERIRRDTDPYIRVYIRLDFFSNVYQKNLFNLMDYMSQVGGLFNSLYGGGKLIVYLFVESIILTSIISSLFKFLPKGEKPSEFIHRAEKRMNLEEESENE